MTEPRPPAQVGQSLPGSEEVGLTRLPRTPSARPLSPRSSPANQPQQAASPAADGQGAPGAAAAPSRARPPPRRHFSWPGRLRHARVPARAPQRRAPRSRLGAPSRALPALSWARRVARAGVGAGHQVLAAGGWGGASDVWGGHTGGPAPARPGPKFPDTAPARSCWHAGSFLRVGPLGAPRLSPACPCPAFSIFPDSGYPASGPQGRDS